MKKSLEKSLQMIKISGSIPDEIASEYERVSNEAYANTDFRFSQEMNDMLQWAPTCIVLRTIGENYYAEVERGFYNNPEQESE